MRPDDNEVTAADVRRLTANVSALAEVVADLPRRLEKLEKREWRSVRLIRALVAGVAVIALLLAVTAVVFGVWNHNQDADRSRSRAARTDQVAALEQKLAAVQQRNTAFREGFCRGAADIRTYLASAPAGPPAGQEAAARLGPLFRSLCSQP